MITVATLTENLLAAYAETETCNACADGNAAQWYAETGAEIRAMATAAQIPAANAFAAFAVMSANSTVDLNFKNFDRWTRGENPRHFGDVVRRAEAALLGRIQEALTYKRGRKIPAFGENLQFPNRNRVVTIDRHAARIALASGAKEAKNFLARKHGYAMLQEAYLAAAAEVGLLGHALQAVLWVHRVDKHAPAAMAVAA